MQSSAFIEGEDYVSADFMLDLHRNFSGEAMHRTVKVRFESHTIIINMCQALFIAGDYLIGSKCFGIHRQNFFKANPK